MSQRWIIDPTQLNPDTGLPGKLVPAEEYVRSSQGHTLVMTDLYMDGVRAPDGSDIGSRKKRREFMRRTGLVDATDYSPDFAAKARASREAQDATRRKEAIIHAVTNPRKRHA